MGSYCITDAPNHSITQRGWRCPLPGEATTPTSLPLGPGFTMVGIANDKPICARRRCQYVGGFRPRFYFQTYDSWGNTNYGPYSSGPWDGGLSDGTNRIGTAAPSGNLSAGNYSAWFGNSMICVNETAAAVPIP